MSELHKIRERFFPESKKKVAVALASIAVFAACSSTGESDTFASNSLPAYCNNPNSSLLERICEVEKNQVGSRFIEDFMASQQLDEVTEDTRQYIDIPDWVWDNIVRDPDNPPDISDYLRVDPSEYAQPTEQDIEYAQTMQGQPLGLTGVDIDHDGYKNLYDDNIDGDQYINSQDRDMDGDGIFNEDDPMPWGEMTNFPYWNSSKENHSDNDWIIDPIDRSPYASEFYDNNGDGHLDIFQVTDGAGRTSTDFSTFQQIHEEAFRQYQTQRRLKRELFDLQQEFSTFDFDIFGFRRDTDGDGVVDAADREPTWDLEW